MNKTHYKPQKEQIGTEEIFGLVFKDSSVKHGLIEFSKEQKRPQYYPILQEQYE